MLDETTYHRQLDLLTPDQAQTPVVVIGCGGIGSTTSLILAKMGCANLTLVDDDVVEQENVPSQLFAPADVGQRKVTAAAAHAQAFAAIEPAVSPQQWDATLAQALRGIAVSAVDSMAARKAIWQTLKDNPRWDCFIEGRMGAEKMRLYCLNPLDERDQQFYESTLYDDAQAEPEVCTAKAIAYNTFVIGGILASFVKHHLRGEAHPRELLFNLATYAFYQG